MSSFFILPTQLFDPDINFLNSFSKIIIYEDPFYLNPLFHKQKLYLHLDSCRQYKKILEKNLSSNVKIIYKYYHELIKFDNTELYNLVNNSVMYDPIDNTIKTKLLKHNINFLDSPAFICDTEYLKNYYECHNTSDDIINYSLSDFYKKLRIKNKILIDKNNKPLGGKWSFDAKNRHKFDKDYKENKFIEYEINKEITNYINIYFPKSIGILKSYYVNNFIDAKNILKYNIKNKIEYFGKYQDAIQNNIIYGNHMNISAYLNIGLIKPNDVIKEVIKYKHHIESAEAIIRQILGWREYMRFIYQYHSKNIIIQVPLNKNIKITKDWYTGTTNIDLIDNIIYKCLNYAYLHHIERLMIINNLFTLMNVKFIDQYNWFMRMFIDSYEWVMIPNIMMNTNSLNTKFRYMKRVYVCSDSYLKKMSSGYNNNIFSFVKNLFKSFLQNNKDILKKDYILSGVIAKQK